MPVRHLYSFGPFLRHNEDMEPVLQKYIDVRTTRGGEQKPFIAGTRISVENIYIWHELRGRTPDEIILDYPHLTLAQIHAALTYFYEHADEIREQLRTGKAYAESMESAAGRTRYSELRDKLLRDKEAHDDSPPS